MKQEDKELLLKDLCGRLPYGVKAYVRNWSKFERRWFEGTYTIASIHPSLNDILVTSDKFSVEVILGYDDYEIKPYLFPLSSMTEEQKKEYAHLLVYSSSVDIIQITEESTYDWLNKNMFDWRGLIPMGLANDATGLNIY